MKCPLCDHEEDKVLESRTTEEGTAIRRRRECLSCGGRFTSYERIEDLRPMVVKKDGRRENYSREKIRTGILRATEKRPIGMEALEGMLDDLERLIFKEGKEIPSSKIGELIMDKLQLLDRVAYVRFASVYRQFQDIKDFVKEIKSLC